MDEMPSTWKCRTPTNRQTKTHTREQSYKTKILCTLESQTIIPDAAVRSLALSVAAVYLCLRSVPI